MQLPALIAEVTFDLAAHAWLCVASQTCANAGVEIVDRLQQAHVADLHEFLLRLAAVLVAQYERAAGTGRRALRTRRRARCHRAAGPGSWSAAQRHRARRDLPSAAVLTLPSLTVSAVILSPST